jgi:hypothetical protein
MNFYGIFKNKVLFRIFGDASGKNNDTRSKRSDYDIIEDYLKNKIRYQMKVPKSNPPIRKRHNLVNAMCKNDKKVVRLFVYKDAPEADKGFRLTKLLPKANYVEDDSFRFQHITTAIGYWICMLDDTQDRKTKTLQL